MEQWKRNWNWIGSCFVFAPLGNWDDDGLVLPIFQLVFPNGLGSDLGRLCHHSSWPDLVERRVSWVSLELRTWKSIKGKVILEDLSFTVERGDCLALIGPNGAGKTTLMNCLLGDMKATSGIGEVEGKAPGHPRLKASVSYLPQENAIVQKLTVQNWSTSFALFINPLTGKKLMIYCVLLQNKRSN